MGKVDSFEQFLHKQKRTVDWEARRKDYVDEVAKFMRQVKGWLAPYEKKGLLTVFDKDRMKLNENPMMQYEAPYMRIQFGDNHVVLEPRGALIVGGLGRMDMRGTNGDVLLILNDRRQWEFLKREPNGVSRTGVEKRSFIEALQALS